eukprot:6804-Heterococcus_DN1.PRE.3
MVLACVRACTYECVYITCWQTRGSAQVCSLAVHKVKPVSTCHAASALRVIKPQCSHKLYAACNDFSSLH